MTIKISVDTAALAVLIGMLPITFLPHLPSGAQWLMISAVTLLLACAQSFFFRWLAIMGTAFLWATAVAQSVMLPTQQHVADNVNVSGVIQNINLGSTADRKIVLRIDQKAGRSVSAFLVSVPSWPTSQPLLAGQRWQLIVNLRPVHSRLNEGGFDRQRWAVANRQVLTGKVKQARQITEESSVRQRYINTVLPKLSHYPYQDVLVALAFGERGLMHEARQKVLQLTGTAHLMAISGLHISLAAMLGWGIVRLLQLALPLRWLTPTLPLLASALTALGYVWLSGFHLPALRALIALLFWLYLRWQGHLCGPWQIWLRCIALLLLLDPIILLSDSFWLSCSAVAALIFWFQWAPLPEKMTTGWRWFLLRWLHLQFGMLLLLAPLQVLLFHGIGAGSLLGNLWAVPLVSLLTVPLILLALLFDPIFWVSQWLWYLADGTLWLAFYPLNFLAQGWFWLDQSVFILSIFGWLAVLIYRLWWWQRYPIALLAIVLLSVVPHWRDSDEQWRVTMLDVGHGLSVVLERHGKALLYDTGNAWEGGSMAKFEVLPYLRWKDLDLEQIIISHQHQDHVGGLADLQQIYPQAKISSSSLTLPSSPCQQGMRWQWQGLNIKVLWPPKQVQRAENPHSCTLRIDDGTHSVLLTGDLEKAQESQLVALGRDELKSDILQVPHHGSQTSSSPTFLRAVKPDLALVSVARYSPWRLPAEKVVARYHKEQITWRDTARYGQLTVRFFRDRWQLSTFRQQLQPRWYHQWFGS